ncbi:hypothetical protein Mapa_009136 [Marchantia paleacea]|nr:hypothetical protein Mapa_009136 [Marchantia paleacea]
MRDLNGFILLSLFLVNTINACSGLSVASAPSPSGSTQPLDFKYTQLWSDADGETHITECKMSGFREEAYSSLIQYVRDDFGGNTTKLVFTELSVNLTQPLHSPPAVQFVVTISGSWYIVTTDGSYRAFQPGEVLFQDDTVDSPAAKIPEHFSGAVGAVPCQQMIIQFNRPPEVDSVCPF